MGFSTPEPTVIPRPTKRRLQIVASKITICGHERIIAPHLVKLFRRSTNRRIYRTDRIQRVELLSTSPIPALTSIEILSFRSEVKGPFCQSSMSSRDFDLSQTQQYMTSIVNCCSCRQGKLDTEKHARKVIFQVSNERFDGLFSISRPTIRVNLFAPGSIEDEVRTRPPIFDCFALSGRFLRELRLEPRSLSFRRSSAPG